MNPFRVDSFSGGQLRTQASHAPGVSESTEFFLKQKLQYIYWSFTSQSYNIIKPIDCCIIFEQMRAYIQLADQPHMNVYLSTKNFWPGLHDCLTIWDEPVAWRWSGLESRFYDAISCLRLLQMELPVLFTFSTSIS